MSSTVLREGGESKQNGKWRTFIPTNNIKYTDISHWWAEMFLPHERKAKNKEENTRSGVCLKQRGRVSMQWSFRGGLNPRESDSQVKSYLQHRHLLAVAEQAEGEGVLVVQAGADLAASQRQRGDVALQVVPVLVEEQLVVLQAAPALPPAVVGQHVQVACQSKSIETVCGRNSTCYVPPPSVCLFVCQQNCVQRMEGGVESIFFSLSLTLR